MKPFTSYRNTICRSVLERAKRRPANLYKKVKKKIKKYKNKHLSYTIMLFIYFFNLRKIGAESLSKIIGNITPCFWFLGHDSIISWWTLNDVISYLAPSTSHWLSNSTHPSDLASATVRGCSLKAKLDRGLNIQVVLKLNHFWLAEAIDKPKTCKKNQSIESRGHYF